MKIAIIGRPNVGKSTLFNRLLGKRQALETEIAGTTRDQNHGVLYWEGQKIKLIDTPGLISHKQPKINLTDEEILEKNIQLQAQNALSTADLILYLIDFQTGPIEEDYNLIKLLKKQKQKPIILVINKSDTPNEQIESNKFINLGLGEPFSVSAINGRGTHELLNKITEFKKMSFKPLFKQPKSKIKQKTLPIIQLALIGKPNVGKSSLFNALLNEERVLVSPIPHTTRDSNNTEIKYQDYQFTLIDTAGLRKKARIYKTNKNKIEIFSVNQTLDKIKQADIALLIVDVTTNITTQDLKIGKLILDANCGLIIIANKWDCIQEKHTNSLSQYRSSLYQQFKSLNWAPIIFTNVKKATHGQIYGLGENYLSSSEDKENMRSLNKDNPMYKLLDLIIAVQKNKHLQIPQNKLAPIIQQALKKQPPPITHDRKRPKILEFIQIAVNPPAFQITLPARQILPDHYLGYLKNQIRANYSFWGTPLLIKCINTQNKKK